MKELLAKFIKSNRGVMLITLLLLIPMFWLLWSLTLDGTDAKYAAVETKTAVSRAVKAAVLAVDKEILATGKIRIDETNARKNFNRLLRLNLALNSKNKPQDNSPLIEAPEILDYYVCQGPTLPYTYNSPIEGISYTFRDPGVLAVIKAKFKYNFMGRVQEIYAYSAAEVKR